MSTLSGSQRLEGTFSTQRNAEYVEYETAEDITITHDTATNPIEVEGYIVYQNNNYAM
jgi:hypothetical protein